MKATLHQDFRTQATETVERAAYRRARGQDPIATACAVVLVGLVGFAFVTMTPIFVKKQASAPTIVTLMTLPDDPPPAEAPPPPPDVATPPPSQVTVPAPIVPTVERPVLQAPVVVAPAAEPAPPRPAPPAPVARGPENLGEISARMISAKPPRYPLDSRRDHEEGTVVLSVLLSIDGRVSDISVARSSGFVRLDRAALDAVRDWRWSPVVRDGNPVVARGLVTIPFVLQGGRDGDHRGGRHRRDGDDRQDGGPDSDQTTA
jgi:protein TonB